MSYGYGYGWGWRRWWRWRSWQYGPPYGPPGPWWAERPPETEDVGKEAQSREGTEQGGYRYGPPHPPLYYPPPWWVAPPAPYPYPYGPPAPQSPEEELAVLEEYKKELEASLRDLQDELKSVEERIEELKRLVKGKES